jgi:TolB-like protein
MKPSLKYIIFMAVLFNIIIAQTPERKNMAVYNFTGLGVSNIEAQVISDRIRVEIGKFDTYSIIERGLMEQILKEQVLQLSGLCDDASCLVEVGQILAVHYIVGGSVSKIGNLFTIEARIIDVESGQIVTSVVEDYNGPIENLLVQTTKVVAEKLIGESADTGSRLLIGTCDLVVQSNPPGGTIYINDKPMGDVTPYRLEGLREGDYTIRVKRGSLVGETAVSLARNERKEITIALEAERFVLRIYSEPEGAIAIINNENAGKTPVDFVVTDTTLDYHIQLRKDLFFDFDETVHFPKTTMLRLNYDLEACGQIKIPYQEEVEVFLNDKPIVQLLNGDVIGSALMRNKRWFIDQLEFTEYQIKIEGEHYRLVEKTVLLTPTQPVRKIDYNLDLLNGEMIIKSNATGSGLLRGDGLIPFKFQANQDKHMAIPFGKYTLSATAQGYLPISQKLTSFKKNLDPITLNFQHPDKKVALKRSLLFPGSGQIYSQQYQKGVILGLITGAGIFRLINSVVQYNKEIENYNILKEGYQAAYLSVDREQFSIQMNESRDDLKNFRVQFQVAASVISLTYSWNIIDITRFYPYE